MNTDWYGAPGLTLVAIEQLGTRFAPLRSATSHGPGALRAGPIRVLACPDRAGHYEVVDGFKRLADYREAGHEQIAVLVEPHGGAGALEIHARLLLLQSNCARSTLTVADQARVVASLVDQERLTEARVGRLLGQGKAWVSKRLTIARRLCAGLVREADAGRLGVTLAYTLCGLSAGDQQRVWQVIRQQALGVREGVMLIEAYRAADRTEQEALLANPASWLDQLRGPRTAAEQLGLGSAAAGQLVLCRELLGLLDRFEQTASGEQLSTDEARLVAAERRRVAARIDQLARATNGEAVSPSQRADTSRESTDERRGTRQRTGADGQAADGAARMRAVGRGALFEEGHRPAARPQRQAGAQDPPEPRPVYPPGDPAELFWRPSNR